MQYPGATQFIFYTKFEKTNREQLLDPGRKQLYRKGSSEVLIFCQGLYPVRGNLPRRTLEHKYLDFIFLYPFIEVSYRESREQGVLWM